MSLTALQVSKAQPSDRPYKLFDGMGLFLLVKPSGSKLWRFRYRWGGKEKGLSFGAYPEVSLAEARQRRANARLQMRDGVNPSDDRKAQSRALAAEQDTFELVALEWFEKFSPRWARSHSSKVIRRLEKDVFPWLGSRQIAAVEATDLLPVLRRIEQRGALETAHRTKQTCGQVFRYAIATGRAQRDCTADLKGALPPPNRKHHASITDRQEIGGLLRAIDGYAGSELTKLALRLAPYVFVRPGELRGAKWYEVDLDRKEWRIDASRMKLRVDHIVPLSEQAVGIFRELEAFSGNCDYVFPGVRSRRRSMSDNTLNAALRRLGYTRDEMTAHGFRSMASTLLNEMGFNRDAIERQLAHTDRNQIRAAYNYAEYLPARVRMMQAWADYLDGLKHGENIIAIGAA